MLVVPVKELLEDGVHFGCRASRWNPKMAPYIFGRRNLIHIIDLKHTLRGLIRATTFLQRLVTEGRQVLFVGTKRQAHTVIQDCALALEMPYVAERWLGGTLTNFQTIRSRLRRLEELEEMERDGSLRQFSKKRMASLMREKRKIFRNLDGIRHMEGLPGAVVIVDPRKEHIAVKEANKLGIPVIAILDTDCDPDPIDIPIPGNDDSMRSIQILIKKLGEAVQAGQSAYSQWLEEERKRQAEEDARRASEKRKIDEAAKRRADERKALKAAQERLRLERAAQGAGAEEPASAATEQRESKTPVAATRTETGQSEALPSDPVPSEVAKSQPEPAGPEAGG